MTRPGALRRPRARLCGVLLALALCVPALPAAADGDPAREHERTTLYQQGVDLAAAGQWADAVARFRKVVEIRASPKVLYTLAEAEEHAGLLAASRASYTASLAAARAARARDVVDLATAALARVGPRVPHIAVRLDENAAMAHAADTHASIDGHAVALGASVDVDPGPHEVRVEATGEAPFVRKVNLSEGQSEDVVVGALAATAPAASPAVAPEPTAQPGPGGHASALAPILVGAAGIAVGVAGIVVRLNGQSDYDGAASRCNAALVCPTPGEVSSGNDGRTRVIAGTVLLGVGAAVAVGAGVWWFLSSRSSVRAGVVVDGPSARAVLGGAF